MKILLGMSFCLVLLTVGLGGMKLIALWQRQVEKQLAVDQCLAKTSYRLKILLNQIGVLNIALLTARQAAAAAVEPVSISTTRAAVTALALSQDQLVTAWRTLRWWSSCPSLLEEPEPPPVERDPPDSNGPQALHWADQPIEATVLRARADNRVGAVALTIAQPRDPYGLTPWRRNWTSYESSNPRNRTH